MAFKERITLVIDTVTGNSTSSLRKLKADIDATDGSWNKLRVGAGAAFDSIKANAGALAIGAGTAIAAFGVKAVGEFQDLALSVGKLSDSLGISAEEASRWAEVAGDLGISTETLERAFGFMNRTAGQSPAVFEQFGVAIARAKDGTVDANQTFLNVIDRLNQIKDPAERAAAAQKLLGRSWMDVAELVGQGADQVKASLDEVSGAKIVTDKQVADARNLRAGLDNLNDALEEITLALGSSLAPAATSAANAIVPLITAIGKLEGVLKTANIEASDQKSFLGQLKDAALNAVNPVRAAQQAIEDAKAALKGDDIDASLALDPAKNAWMQVADAVEDAGVAADDTAGELQALADADKRASGAAKEHVDALREQADALTETADAMRSSVDATFAAEDAQSDFAEAVRESNEVQGDAERTAEEKADAVKRERDALLDAADAASKKADADATAAGRTASSTEKLDAFNRSLLDNASRATPAARAEIVRYIAQLNGISEEKATEILALVDQGLLDQADSELRTVSRPRDAYMKADAQNVAATEAELANLARTRTATIVARNVGFGAANASGQTGARAKGGPVQAGQPYLVGEKGPEIVVPGQSGTVIPNDKAFGSGSPVAASGGGTVIQIANVNLPPGTDGRDLTRQLARYARYNGPNPR